MTRRPISRGDVVHASMDPTQGHEQGGRRPHLVISRPQHEQLFGLVIAIPMTHTRRGWPSHIEIEPGSYAMCEQPRTISVSRITRVERRGLVEHADQAAAIIKRLINL